VDTPAIFAICLTFMPGLSISASSPYDRDRV